MPFPDRFDGPLSQREHALFWGTLVLSIFGVIAGATFVIQWLAP